MAPGTHAPPHTSHTASESLEHRVGGIENTGQAVEVLQLKGLTQLPAAALCGRPEGGQRGTLFSSGGSHSPAAAP